MYPILYETTETEFESNGIGRLSDAKECVVTEVRNGEYELSMMYPTGGKYFREITPFRIISATHDPTGDIQPFDIYHVSTPSDGYIEVRARHISYRTQNTILAPNLVMGYLSYLFDALNTPGTSWDVIGEQPFTFYTDVDTESTLSHLTKFDSVKSYLYGTDESGVIGAFGWEYDAEYKLDKWQISFLKARGTDTGAKFRVGKNVKLLTREKDVSDIVTAVVPYWYGRSPVTGDAVQVDLKDEGYILQYSNAASYDRSLVKVLDLSSVWAQPPTTTELKAGAQEWMSRHNYNVDRESYIITVTNADSATIQAISECCLCDVVTVEDPVNEYSVKLKVTEGRFDVLRDRWQSVVVGDRRKTISEALKKQNDIYIERINRNVTEIETLSAKKAQVTQTVTPTTAGATEIAQVDGTKIYAVSGGGSASDKKAGGASNQYGQFQIYSENDALIGQFDKDGFVYTPDATGDTQASPDIFETVKVGRKRASSKGGYNVTTDTGAVYEQWGRQQTRQLPVDKTISNIAQRIRNGHTDTFYVETKFEEGDAYGYNDISYVRAGRKFPNSGYTGKSIVDLVGDVTVIGQFYVPLDVPSTVTFMLGKYSVGIQSASDGIYLVLDDTTSSTPGSTYRVLLSPTT